MRVQHSRTPQCWPCSIVSRIVSGVRWIIAPSNMEPETLVTKPAQHIVVSGHQIPHVQRLYHWCGADVDSVLGHFVVVASRGRSRLAHLDKPQGSSMTGSFALPFLHVQDDIGEVDHGVLYRLVQDMRVKSRDTN